MSNAHLGIYLNDHLAGATGALELLTQIRKNQADTAMAEVLSELSAEIDAERQELEGLIQRLDVPISEPRKLGAWLGEQLAHVKLLIDDKTQGELLVFEGLEALGLGIHGKRGLWRVLDSLTEVLPALRGIDYAGLVQRSEDQQRRVEALRLAAAKAAFTAVPQ